MLFDPSDGDPIQGDILSKSWTMMAIPMVEHDNNNKIVQGGVNEI